VVLKQEFNLQAAFQIPTCILHGSAPVERKEDIGYSIEEHLIATHP
jgi:hypothetical protein